MLSYGGPVISLKTQVMSVFNNAGRISRAPFVRNMLNRAEQVQIQKYETHAYKTPKTAGVQTNMIIHPTKQVKK